MSVQLTKRLRSKIDSSHIVWFQESNSWLQFEEPAWFVYQRLHSEISADNISKKISRRYHLNESKSLSFVTEIISKINKLSTTTFQPQDVLPEGQIPSPNNFYSVRTYKFKNKFFEISYGSRFLEYSIHGSFAHLEANPATNPGFRIEVFPSGSEFVLKQSDKAWIEENANLIKRRLFIAITELLYGKPNDKWLSFVHGSAISNGKESIILSTACGSGKSTLAALLCTRGFSFVSDDYVPIDARYCKAYPFPAALSVKDGAFPVLSPFFSRLKDTELYHFKGTNKTVRYLAFPDSGNFYKPLPVRNLIFVQYDVNKLFSFRKVPTLEAIRRFNEEAWLSPIPAHARKFIKWFPKLNCYELIYSDNNAAVSEISKLFGMPLKKASDS